MNKLAKIQMFSDSDRIAQELDEISGDLPTFHRSLIQEARAQIVELYALCQEYHSEIQECKKTASMIFEEMRA